VETFAANADPGVLSPSTGADPRAAHPRRPAHKSFLLALARFFDRLAGYRVYRAIALAGVELAIALIAAVTAIAIIQSGEFWKWQSPLLFAGLVLVSSKILVGLATQSFSGRWRYVGVRDAAIVTRAAVIAAVLAFAMLEFLNLAGVRLRLVGADVVIYLVLACGMRLTIRSLHEWERRVRIGNGTARRRALIVGAGESGSALIKSMLSSPKLGSGAWRQSSRICVPSQCFHEDAIPPGQHDTLCQTALNRATAKTRKAPSVRRQARKVAEAQHRCLRYVTSASRRNNNPPVR